MFQEAPPLKMGAEIGAFGLGWGGSVGSDSRGRKRHKHKLSEVHTDFLDRRRAPHGGAGRAPRARDGGSSADPGNPRGLPKVCVYGIFSSSMAASLHIGGDESPRQIKMEIQGRKLQDAFKAIGADERRQLDRDRRYLIAG